MIGTVVIGVVVITLFLAFSLANRIALRTKHVALAKGVAETEIERVRAEDWGSLAVGTTTSPVGSLPGGQKTVTVRWYDADGNGTAEEADKTKEIVVTVSWRERQGTASIALTTLATEGGMGR